MVSVCFTLTKTYFQLVIALVSGPHSYVFEMFEYLKYLNLYLLNKYLEHCFLFICFTHPFQPTVFLHPTNVYSEFTYL